MNLKSIKKVLKFAFSGFSIFFIAMLVSITIYGTLTGELDSTTSISDLCETSYGNLASPECW
jgi:hypothetical protein